MSRFEIYLSKNDLEHIANGYDIKIKIDGKRFLTTNEIILKPELVEEFGRCNIYSREECEDCWAKLYCSGGCAANSYHATGSITGVYDYGCKLFQKRIECAIMMKVAEQDEVLE